MNAKTPHRLLRLDIDPVIQRAEQLAEQVRRELPSHGGIIRAAQGIAEAAHEAKRVARALRRPWGLHRLPAAFAAVALLLFAVWIYWNFFYVATLRIALPKEDAMQLHERLAHGGRVRFEKTLTEGSRESLQLLLNNQVDLAFIQGGIPVPDDLPRRQNPSPELVLYFVRQGVNHPQDIRRMLTSAPGQGSHSVAQVFARTWEIDGQVQFVHDWRPFNADPAYQIPADIDAVFVIKDIAEDKTLEAAERLAAAGFRLTSPDIGAHAVALDYLRPAEIPAGYLSQQPPVPEQAVATYSVATYLVARRGLTPRLLAAAAHLLDTDANTLSERGYEPTLEDAAAVLQGLEAFLSVLVYIGLAFLALLGLEITTYRRRFHELNTLISLISMHQSDKDVLGLDLQRNPAGKPAVLDDLQRLAGPDQRDRRLLLAREFVAVVQQPVGHHLRTVRPHEAEHSDQDHARVDRDGAAARGTRRRSPHQPRRRKLHERTRIPPGRPAPRGWADARRRDSAPHLPVLRPDDAQVL